jgi:hypothetical protein
MNVREQIKDYIASQLEPKRADINELHRKILVQMPKCKLWFLDGKDSNGKIVSNPSIGYGLQVIKYADGTKKDFYRIGMSANTSGISIYILGLEDKKHLAKAYGSTIGKASITGYCIKFRKLADINIDVLCAAVRYGAEHA